LLKIPTELEKKVLEPIKSGGFLPKTALSRNGLRGSDRENYKLCITENQISSHMQDIL
jgi:hypothetical protein